MLHATKTQIEMSEQDEKDGCYIRCHIYELTEEYDLHDSDGKIIDTLVFDMS